MWWWDDMEPDCYECYDSTIDLDSPNPDEPWPCGHCNDSRQLWRDALQQEHVQEQFEPDYGDYEERI
jgi:hypothetical protein